MTHIAFDHGSNHRHTGSHFGEVGFYSLLGMAAVTLLIGFGIYELAQHALQGVAAMLGGV